MIFIPQKYGKNNQYVWEVEILTATKTTILNQNLCCRKSKQDRVIDATFGCYGDFYAEQVDILISKNQALQI